MTDTQSTAPTGPKILFIDDEKNVLAAIHRQLRKDFNILPALSGEEGLLAVDKHKPAVVVCDMRMPGMDGVSTLAEIEKRSPDTIRIMLTGNADQETAVGAINRGKIFRFLNKPCSEETLKLALQDALRQHELITAEKALLSQTLTGSVRALVDILSLVAPDAFARSGRVRQWARAVGEAMGLQSRWELDLAAMLYPIGLVSVPPALLEKMASGVSKLNPTEKAILARSPDVGRRLLMHIPRMARVSDIVFLQDRGFNGSGFPEKGPLGQDIPIESRILRVLKDLVELCTTDVPPSAAVEKLLGVEGPYDAKVLDAIRQLWGMGPGPAMAKAQSKRMSINLDTLLPNDLLMAPVVLASGKLLLSEGIRITAAQIERLRNFRELESVQEPIVIERVVSEG